MMRMHQRTINNFDLFSYTFDVPVIVQNSVHIVFLSVTVTHNTQKIDRKIYVHNFFTIRNSEQMNL